MRRLQACLAVALGVFAAGLCPGSADAGRVALTGARTDLRQGPEIVGSRVGWLEETCFGDCAVIGPSDPDGFRVRFAGRTGRVRTLARGGLENSRGGSSVTTSEEVHFAASEEWLALQRDNTGTSLGGSFQSPALTAGPFGKRRQPVVACVDRRGITGVPVDLAGDLLAFNAEPCSSARLGVRDLRSGATSQFGVPPGAELSRVAVAGSLVASVRSSYSTQGQSDTLSVIDARPVPRSTVPRPRRARWSPTSR